MRLKFLQKDVRRNFENDIWDEENRQCSVVLGASRNAEVIFEAKNSCITDVHTARKERSNIRAIVFEKYGLCQQALTGQGKPRGKERRDMEGCANQFWPSACALL